MKIVYVADNRNRGNYGCRATSTALSQLISEDYEIVGRISGRYTHNDTGELFFVKWFPAKTYEVLGRLKYWKDIKKIFYMFFRFLKRGGKYYYSNYDFISHDLDESINNLIKCLPANPALKEFDLRQYDFDALVINGEGSYIFSTPPWRESLIISMVIHWSQKLGKKVYFMNAMFSDSPYSDRNMKTIKVVNEILGKSQLVAVREPYSYNYAIETLKLNNPKIFPDALFTWYSIVNDEHKIMNGKYYIPHGFETDESYYEFDFTKPYICISGSSAAGKSAKNTDELIKSYSNLVKKLRSKFKGNIFLVHVCEGDDFLLDVGRETEAPVVPLNTPLIAAAKILSNARIYISGRYHPAIMASLGGTPCVFMSSNSHKTKSLQELLEYDEIIEFNVVPNKQECELIITQALFLYSQGSSLRDKINDRAKILCDDAKKMKEEIRL